MISAIKAAKATEDKRVKLLEEIKKNCTALEEIEKAIMKRLEDPTLGTDVCVHVNIDSALELEFVVDFLKCKCYSVHTGPWVYGRKQSIGVSWGV